MTIDNGSGPDAPNVQRGVRRPRRAFAVLVAVALASMLAGVALASLVRSPAQQLADARPPGLSVITAKVREQVLEAEVVTRGTVEMGRTVRVGPVKTSAALSVVTKIGVTVGARVQSGDVVIEISGRPVFMLQGEFPAYRNLAVGDEGPDATAVNNALKLLKLSHGPAAKFTSETADGLAKLYLAAGYQPPSDVGLDLREVVFVPASEASVLAVSARVGESSEQADLVVLAAGETGVTAQVPPDQIASIEVGNKATIHLADGTSVEASVESLSTGATLDETQVILRPADQLAAELNGSDVRVVITQTSTGKSSLTVPVPAIFAQADGGTVVVRLGEQGSQEVIDVNVGEIVGGFAVITTAEGASLREGDEVVVSGPGLGD